jgi:hypothetical protein
VASQFVSFLTTHRVTPAAQGSVAGTLAVGSGVHADETVGTDRAACQHSGLKERRSGTLGIRLMLQA